MVTDASPKILQDPMNRPNELSDKMIEWKQERLEFSFFFFFLPVLSFPKFFPSLLFRGWRRPEKAKEGKIGKRESKTDFLLSFLAIFRLSCYYSPRLQYYGVGKFAD